MRSIDEIINMLDWDNSEDIQNEGIKLAANVEHIDSFIQPLNKGKCIWENCAKVINNKSDEELTNYLSRLLLWLQDLNWPGAIVIMERLIKYQNKQYILQIINNDIIVAKRLNDTIWKENLLILKNEIENNE